MNKSGNIQKFHCRDCHHYFSINIGFERMKHNPQAIASAIQLCFSGESLRNTMDILRLLGVEVQLMKEYTESIMPKVGDTWRPDESYIKVKGNMKYLFSMMDDETRFWIAQEIAETKDKHDSREFFCQAKRLMEKQPKHITTDGLRSYAISAKAVFPEAIHTREITLRGELHNNKMERMNGEIRDREKTMRGLKTNETEILSGYQLFHKYFRPHEALGGKTPADACGIIVEERDKWKTLIQNAVREQRKEPFWWL